MYNEQDIGEGNTSRKGVLFVPHVTLGNVLTIIAFTFTALAQWFTYDKRLTLVERTTLEQGHIITQVSENQAGLIRTQDKLLFMFEEAQRIGVWSRKQ